MNRRHLTVRSLLGSTIAVALIGAAPCAAQVTPAAGYTPPDDTPKIAVGVTITRVPATRGGDRYKSLCLHDPVWYDHLPYIKFPENWPVFSPKDKIADWLEAYTKVMELNYWGSSECHPAPGTTRMPASGRSTSCAATTTAPRSRWCSSRSSS